MVRLAILIGIILIIQSSCTKLFTDDILSLERIDNNSNKLNLNGYYSFEYNKNNFNIYFLYENGIIIYGYSPSKDEINHYETIYKNGEFYKDVQNIKFHWGVYHIDGNIIKFERWYPSEKPYRATVREGEILNDSTFIITKSYKGNKSRERNEVYKFHQFSPKPDSTNAFIN